MFCKYSNISQNAEVNSRLAKSQKFCIHFKLMCTPFWEFFGKNTKMKMFEKYILQNSLYRTYFFTFSFHLIDLRKLDDVPVSLKFNLQVFVFLFTTSKCSHLWIIIYLLWPNNSAVYSGSAVSVAELSQAWALGNNNRLSLPHGDKDENAG